MSTNRPDDIIDELDSLLTEDTGQKKPTQVSQDSDEDEIRIENEDDLDDLLGSCLSDHAKEAKY